jgi:hypothetical protein
MNPTQKYIEALRKERDELKLKHAAMRDAVKEAVGYAGNKYFDWGDRAEHCFDMLEAAIRNDSASPPDWGGNRD